MSLYSISNTISTLVAIPRNDVNVAVVLVDLKGYIRRKVYTPG